MTLQEAHERQRRELLSLRAENKRLQKQASGVFPAEEKEALERHIRHLEQVNKAEASKHDAARAQWKCTEDRCFELELEVLDLREQLAALREENEALRVRAEKAEAEVSLLNGTRYSSQPQ